MRHFVKIELNDFIYYSFAIDGVGDRAKRKVHIECLRQTSYLRHAFGDDAPANKSKDSTPLVSGPDARSGSPSVPPFPCRPFRPPPGAPYAVAGDAE